MVISGFIINKYKAKCFNIRFNPSKIIPLLFIGTIGLDVWHILTVSGLELTNGKDIYSFLNNIRLSGEYQDYEFLYNHFKEVQLLKI